MSTKKELSRREFVKLSAISIPALCYALRTQFSGKENKGISEKDDKNNYYQIYLLTLEQIKASGNTGYYQYFTKEYIPPNMSDLENDPKLPSLVKFGRAYDEPVMLRNEAIPSLVAFAEEINSGRDKLFITSAFRSFDRQKLMYLENKNSSNPVIMADPGYSPHQSGFAVDLDIIIDGKFQNMPKNMIDLASSYGLLHTNPLDSEHFLIAKPFLEAGVSGRGFENKDYPKDTTYGWNQFLSNLVKKELGNKLDHKQRVINIAK